MVKQIGMMLLMVALVGGECPAQDNSLAPRPITRATNMSTCVSPYQGAANCTCPPHLFECACLELGSCQPDKPSCVEMWSLHNNRNDCGDWSDELTNICPGNHFQCHCHNTTCTQGGNCLAIISVCDSIKGCPDGSDEIGCACPADMFECRCYRKGNCTGGAYIADQHGQIVSDSFSNGCIDTSKVCNGINDCGDWTDEINCTCPSGTFECQCYRAQACVWIGCLTTTELCDGHNGCGDWGDEANCTCPAGTLECPCYKHKSCSRDWGCLLAHQICDGRPDCSDWSDEANCTAPIGAYECSWYRNKNCTSCFQLGYIHHTQQCDGTKQCEDGSDEANCTCPSDKFACACVGLKQCVGTDLDCVDRSEVCDGKRDCVDGSDETSNACNCSGSPIRCTCDPSEANCPASSIKCIPYDWVGDTVKDCANGEDERCSSGSFSCQSCMSVYAICNTEVEARKLLSAAPHVSCNPSVSKQCSFDENRCSTSEVVCTTSPGAGGPCSDLCRDVFLCENRQVIAKSAFCDDLSNPTNDCSDKSDEILEGFGFKCSGLSRKAICVLPQANVYDTVAQCSDGSDICFLNGQFRCFQCLDKRLVVSGMQVCDGVADCYDMSDECLCADQSVCRGVMGECPRNQILCNGSSACVDRESALCNFSVQCANQTNTKYCSAVEVDSKLYLCPASVYRVSSLNESAVQYPCTKLEYLLSRYAGQPPEAMKEIVPHFCTGTVKGLFSFQSELYCPGFYRCFNNGEINIAVSRVCDGRVDCDDGSDEFLAKCMATRFHCKNKGRISIDKTYVCDGIIDCEDGSDESRCRCQSARFYCTNEQPLSVDIGLVDNGIDDCFDGSDECVDLAGNAFANVNEMIANIFYRAIFWIMAMLALGGNLYVFVSTALSLAKSNNKESVFVCTSVFILNLSAADFLMGVYLLGIIIQAARFSGSYCLDDKAWRSSDLCSAFGSLAVISSEASSFTMTAMTTFRLISSFKPFLMRNVSAATVVIAEMLCWIASILLAVVPLLPATSGYFVNSVWFPNNVYQSDLVSRRSMSLLAERVSQSNLKTWNNVKQAIKEAFPRQHVNGEFGYYGETSVCLPRLFATKGQYAWEYSTFLITINFLMFSYMVIAYVLIFRQSNRMKAARGHDKSSKMQKRITRLILTDFCCWIPVCVMGFLSVGGVKMPPDAYVLSACLLLPINSSINPLLYSRALEERLRRAKSQLTDVASSFFAAKSDANVSNEGGSHQNRSAQTST